MTSPESPFFDIPRAEWIASNRSAFAVWDASHDGFVQRDHRAERAPLRFSYLQSHEARRRAVEFPSQPAGS